MKTESDNSVNWLTSSVRTYTSNSVPTGCGLFLVPNLLKDSACLNIIDSMQSKELADSRIVGDGTGSMRDRSVRRSTQAQLPNNVTREVSHSLAQQIKWLRKKLDLPIRFATPPIFLKYKTGDFFTPHQDNSGQQSGNRLVGDRLATYIIYLSSHRDVTSNPASFCGGRFIAYTEYNPFLQPEQNPRKFAIAPSAGDLLVFPSSMYHAAEPVTENVRYCIIGWLFENVIE